ncbi:MAG: HYR domain-containing protein, partial [Saprospiraceae bacterium]|nr:HYR domain-containing protein [Saprospiraceae bacterium]
LQQTILLCPGESVSLGGNSYSQPGTVTLALPASAGGCDTIASYTLEFKTNNQPNTVQITCPANQVVTVPGGTPSAAVSYGLAMVLSDCPCPGNTASLQSGKASGEQFPLGLSTVCYRGEDACGNARTCCFTVTVEEESGCDEKNSGCLRFELLKINRDAAKNWVYYVRVTNQCTSALRYAWLQIPDGLPALEPAGGNLYTTANGRNYELRNPNFSPFYSLRFKPLATGLIGGESDVFRYVLPQQASVEYIHAAVRLESGAYYETHLNTFFCPPGTEPQQKQALADRNEKPAGQPRLSVFPNPTVSGSTLILEGQAIEAGIFELRDLTGRAIARLPISANQVSLNAGKTGAGVYFFQVFDKGQPAGTGKLVLLR